jgi:hypothetical protein
MLSTLRALKATKDIEHSKPIEQSPRYNMSVYRNQGRNTLATMRYGAKEPPHKHAVNTLDNYNSRLSASN